MKTSSVVGWPKGGCRFPSYLWKSPPAPMVALLMMTAEIMEIRAGSAIPRMTAWEYETAMTGGAQGRYIPSSPIPPRPDIVSLVSAAISKHTRPVPVLLSNVGKTLVKVGYLMKLVISTVTPWGHNG